MLEFPIKLEYIDETAEDVILVPLADKTRVQCPIRKQESDLDVYRKILDMQLQGEQHTEHRTNYG